MKKLTLSSLLCATLLSTEAITLTALDSIPFASLEFNDDASVTNGPDYNYIWLAPGTVRNINGIVFTGPGWYEIVYDSSWNAVTEQFYAGTYTITTVCGVDLVSFYLGGPAGATQWFSRDGTKTFLKEWTLRNGTYVACPKGRFAK